MEARHIRGATMPAIARLSRATRWNTWPPAGGRGTGSRATIAVVTCVTHVHADEVVGDEAVEDSAEEVLGVVIQQVLETEHVCVVTTPAGTSAAINVMRLVAAATSR